MASATAPTPEPAVLRVSEVFVSLQGESSLAGWPTVFVRLTGCPLRCRWCDTAYAFEGGERRPLGAVVEQVRGFGVEHVTVTGGEPLAQAGTPQLLVRLVAAGFLVSLETAGALSVAGIDPRVKVVMDLKAPGSGECHRNRFDNIDRLKPGDEIKFVLADRADFDWATAVIRSHRLAQRFEVLVSPVAGALDPRTLADWVVSERLPVRFQLQLHKLLWGDERGR